MSTDTEINVETQLACSICTEAIETSACADQDQPFCGECALHYCGDCYLAHTETLSDKFISRWSA